MILHMTNDGPGGITGEERKNRGGALLSRGTEMASWSPRTFIITYKMQLFVSCSLKGFVPRCCCHSGTQVHLLTLLFLSTLSASWTAGEAGGVH